MLKSTLVLSALAASTLAADLDDHGRQWSASKIQRRKTHKKVDDPMECLTAEPADVKVSPQNPWPMETDLLDYFMMDGDSALYLKCRAAEKKQNFSPKYQCWKAISFDKVHPEDESKWRVKFYYWVMAKNSREIKCRKPKNTCKEGILEPKVLMKEFECVYEDKSYSDGVEYRKKRDVGEYEGEDDMYKYKKHQKHSLVIVNPPLVPEWTVVVYFKDPVMSGKVSVPEAGSVCTAYDGSFFSFTNGMPLESVVNFEIDFYDICQDAMVELGSVRVYDAAYENLNCLVTGSGSLTDAKNYDDYDMMMGLTAEMEGWVWQDKVAEWYSDEEYTCGMYAYENDDGDCVCEAGYAWEDNHYDCGYVDSMECGDYAHMMVSGCMCNMGYEWADDDMWHCVMKDEPSECGMYAEIKFDEFKCTCMDGYVWKDDAKWDCHASGGSGCGLHAHMMGGKCMCDTGYAWEADHYNCGWRDDMECGMWAHPMVGGCMCNAGYVWEHESMRGTAIINTDANCVMESSGSDCGDYAELVDGECECSEGYKWADSAMWDCMYMGGSDCGDYASRVDGECECWDGYKWADSSMWDCMYMMDPTGSPCGEYAHMVEGKCECQEGYKWADSSMWNCMYMGGSDCGTNAHMMGGKCMCDPGHAWEPDHYNCGPRDDMECGMHAHPMVGGCMCNPGYVWDHDTLPESMRGAAIVNTNVDCVMESSGSDCGVYAHMVDGECECREDYKWADSSMWDCVYMGGSDCGDYASRVDGECECWDGYKWADSSMWDCMDPDTDPSSSPCGEYASMHDGECKCWEDYKWADSSMWDCKYMGESTMGDTTTPPMDTTGDTTTPLITTPAPCGLNAIMNASGKCVCKTGYAWESDHFNCGWVGAMECGMNAHPMVGGCMCNPGYVWESMDAWNASGRPQRACVLHTTPEPTTTGAPTTTAWSMSSGLPEPTRVSDCSGDDANSRHRNCYCIFWPGDQECNADKKLKDMSEAGIDRMCKLLRSRWFHTIPAKCEKYEDCMWIDGDCRANF